LNDGLRVAAVGAWPAHRYPVQHQDDTRGKGLSPPRLLSIL
jgi:hypothetical protein